MEEKNKKYPEGHFVGLWMGIGVAIFAGFGIPLAIILEIPWIIALGPAAGVAFGLAIGSSIESKHKKEGKIRPLTEDEKKKRRMFVITGTMVFIVGLVILLLRLFL